MAFLEYTILVTKNGVEGHTEPEFLATKAPN